MPSLSDTLLDYKATSYYDVLNPSRPYYQYIDPGSAYFFLGTPDNVPPLITNFVPSVGSAILASSSIQFDVTDASGLRRVLLIAEFVDGTWDAVHDGDTFAPKYIGSSRTPITNGYTFTVSKVGGWTSSPTFRIIAIDVVGNESA